MNLLPGDFSGQLGIDHFKVPATPAASAILPVVRQFNQGNPGKRFNHFPGCIINLCAPAQITGVAVTVANTDVLGEEVQPFSVVST